MMTSVTQSNRVKIGIRPTIDGRRMGVRESLEEQTMQMAKSVAELLQNHIRHTDGSFVECVIADTCIGGVAEAAACAEKFKLNNVGLTITVTPCWCYGSETIDMDPHMPKAIWGFNGTERPGAVYLAAALAGHSQLGLPAFSIYGHDVQEADDTSIPSDVKEKIVAAVQNFYREHNNDVEKLSIDINPPQYRIFVSRYDYDENRIPVYIITIPSFYAWFSRTISIDANTGDILFDKEIGGGNVCITEGNDEDHYINEYYPLKKKKRNYKLKNTKKK